MESATIIVPPSFENATKHLVTLIGGPMNLVTVEWYNELKRFVMADYAGGYEITERGKFAEWRATDAGE